MFVSRRATVAYMCMYVVTICIHAHIDIHTQLGLCSPTYNNLPYKTYYVAHIRMLSNINCTWCRGIL